MRQATESIDGPAGPARILTGTIIGGRFRVEALLAREAGSLVYRASDVQAGTTVALRVVPLAAIVNGVDRLVAELEKTQALRHKNLVDVEAVGREGDFLYVASELVDGQSLRAFIDGKRAEGRGVSLKGASNLVAHVANALDYAKRVTVHGALSPAVVWVNRTGRVKVAAVGLGGGLPGLARHGAPAGAPDSVYVAPEVLAGATPTMTADVFSLGVILYELLTGHPPGPPPPGQRPSGHQMMPASAVASEVPATVDAVIERALHADPDARWPSVMAMKDALQVAAGFATPAAAAASAAAGGPRQSSPIAIGAAAEPGKPASAPQGQGLALLAAPVAPQLRPASNEPTSGLFDLRTQATAAAPAGGPEDAVERWLVHKDRLDFGPFSMTQLRAQIERGEILPDHLLVDNESGARCKVKEYPGLGDLAKTAHRRIEQVRRAQAEQRSAKSEKKKSFATTLIVGLVLAAVLGGVGLYVISRRDSAGGHLASREEEAEIESFLKGVKIGGMKASVRRGGHRASGSASGGSAEDFNNDSNFGDASKGLTEGDQTLDDDQIQNTMMSNYRKLIPCIVHGGVSEIAMEFVVRGTGKVSAVKVNGQRTGALPACLLGRMQSFSFPKFNGSKTIASWSMSMGH